MRLFILQYFLGFLFFINVLSGEAVVHRHKFVVEETPYTRLCSSKNILTVNGKFPGPTLYARKGDTIIVDVFNRATENITIHWHGVKQPRNPWSDGPEFITQCPIQPGANFSQRVVLSDEEGTIWWHAHSDWSRATVHGAFFIYPKKGTDFPFPKPHAEFPIILGEWWKSDIFQVLRQFLRSGGDPNISDAYLINGQPGDLYPCSSSDTYRLKVEHGKTYLMRMVNSVMNNIMFFAIANHTLIVVGTDGSYTKPIKTNFISISPGQTIDFLLEANQSPNSTYYMASRALNSNPRSAFDNTTTTAIVEYTTSSSSSSSSSTPIFPYLPNINDTSLAANFTDRLRGLNDHPSDLPLNISDHMLFTVSINTFSCPNNSCRGPGGSRFAASVNNISFVMPQIDILEAYYSRIDGVYGKNFPSFPPYYFNFTAPNIPRELRTPENRTEVRVLEYGSTVELVFQNTNLVSGIDHPMHLHGYSFYVVGSGDGIFDEDEDPKHYNLVDPPLQNTIAVRYNGWAAIRFRANNPGVWFMHCHLERHTSWGMEMAFIVKNGKRPEERMLPPPSYMPPC